MYSYVVQSGELSVSSIVAKVEAYGKGASLAVEYSSGTVAGTQVLRCTRTSQTHLRARRRSVPTRQRQYS